MVEKLGGNKSAETSGRITQHRWRLRQEQLLVGAAGFSAGCTHDPPLPFIERGTEQCEAPLFWPGRATGIGRVPDYAEPKF